MGDHASRSPSSSNQWLNCPGSIGMSEGCPDSDSGASREGTFAHDIASRALDGDRDVASFIGETDGEFTVDAAMAEKIQIYVDVVNAMAFMADRVGIEQKVVFTEENWGTADAMLVTGRVLDVVDLKFGTFYVSADMNTQLLDYACAAVRSWELDGKLDTVRLHIVQPRHYDPEDVHRVFTISMADLKAWQDNVLDPGLFATFDVRARLVAGKHCHWCKAKIKCPAFNGLALEVAQEVFPDGDVETPAVAPKPESLSVERIQAILAGAPVLLAWVKAVEAYAHTRAKAGLAIKGFKLVQTIGNRRYVDEDKAALALKGEGLDPYVKHVLSPNQAQQALGNSKAHKAFIDELCERKITGDALVVDTDKRPALPQADVFPELKD
jgi:hypothetical protein